MFIHMHDFELKEKSNIIQFDDTGYPVRLCLLVCRCGMSKQEWLYTNRVEDDIELKWSEISDEEKISEAADKCRSPCKKSQKLQI